MLTAVAVYSALKKRVGRAGSASTPTTEIMVAAHDLPLGTRIDASALKSVRWPTALLPRGAIINKEGAMGSIVESAFITDEPLMAEKLVSSNKQASVLQSLIPPHMRAMSVPVDEVGDLAGFVLPHSRVDVLVAVSQRDGQGGSVSARAKIVLEDVEVLAIAQTVEGKDKPQVEKVVTLLVTPEGAEQLALAAHEGVLRLVLRGYNDHDVFMTAGSDLQHMFGVYGRVAPAKTPQHHAFADVTRSERHIEIIRDGSKVETLSFSGNQLMANTQGQTRKILDGGRPPLATSQSQDAALLTQPGKAKDNEPQTYGPGPQ